MASDTTIPLDVVIGGDASGVVKAGQDASGAIKGVGDAAKVATNETNAAAAAGEKLAAGHKHLASAAGESTEQLHSLARGMRFAVSGALTMEGQFQHVGHAIVGAFMGIADPMMGAAMAFGIAIDLISKNLEGIKKLFGDVGTASKDAADAIIKATQDAATKQLDMLTASQKTTRELRINSFVAGLDPAVAAQVRGIVQQMDALKSLRDFEKQYGLAASNPESSANNAGMMPAAQTNTTGTQAHSVQDYLNAANPEEIDKVRVVQAGVGEAWRKNKESLEQLYAILQDNVRATKLETQAQVDLANAKKESKFENEKPGASSIGNVIRQKESDAIHVGGPFNMVSQVMTGFDAAKKAIEDMYRGAEELANLQADREGEAAEAFKSNQVIYDYLQGQEQLLSGQGMFAEAAAVAEHLADVASTAGNVAEAQKAQLDAVRLHTQATQQAEEAQRQLNAIFVKNAQEMQRVAGSIITGIAGGHGGSAIGGAMGNLLGMGAGMALGDPTGMVGGGIGSALGSQFGGIFDALKPLQDVGAQLGKDFAAMAQPVAMLAQPLMEFAQFFGQMVNELFPAWVPIFRSLTEVLSGLVGVAEVALDVYTLLDAVITSIVDVVLVPFGSHITGVEAGLTGFTQSLLQFTNEVIQFADSLGANIAQVDPNAVYGMGCFVGGTPVDTPAGQMNIELVEIGDFVDAWDEFGMVDEPCRVTAVHAYDVEETLTLIVDGITLVTTPEHPFRCEGAWRRAGALVVGCYLVGKGGKPLLLTSMKKTGPARVYNITVDGAHTFYVGACHALVHNKDSKRDELAAAKENAKALRENTRALQAQQDNLPPGVKTGGYQFAAASPTIIVVNTIGEAEAHLRRSSLNNNVRFGSIAQAISGRHGDAKG